MSAVLAVDYGSVRIGLAINEGAGLPALPLATISHTTRARDIEQIVTIARDRGVDVIVVGYPIRMDGSSGPAAKKVDAFISALRAAFPGEIALQDERFSTGAATQKLRELEISGSKRRRYVDQLAAVEILQSYLSLRHES